MTQGYPQGAVRRRPRETLMRGGRRKRAIWDHGII